MGSESSRNRLLSSCNSLLLKQLGMIFSLSSASLQQQQQQLTLSPLQLYTSPVSKLISTSTRRLRKVSPALPRPLRRSLTLCTQLQWKNSLPSPSCTSSRSLLARSSLVALRTAYTPVVVVVLHLATIFRPVPSCPLVNLLLHHSQPPHRYPTSTGRTSRPKPRPTRPRPSRSAIACSVCTELSVARRATLISGRITTFRSGWIRWSGR